MNVNYYKFEQGRKKETERMLKNRQQFIGIRREERKRVLDELLEKMKQYQHQIELEELEKIISELKEKDFKKTRRFC